MMNSMKKKWFKCFGLFILVMFILSLAHLKAIANDSNHDAANDLFTDSLNKADLYRTDDLTIIRTRFVDIKFDLLVGADGHLKEQSDSAKVLSLNLFGDVFFTAILDRSDSNTSGGFSWIGHLKGVEHSQVILVVDDGIMSGNITLPGAFYQVRYAGNGVHAIYKIDQSAFPPEADPIPVDTLEDDSAEAPDTNMLAAGSTIDVLVV